MFNLVNKLLLMTTLFSLTIPTFSNSQADIANNESRAWGSEQQEEVAHLLEFVRNSACTMMRNGASHNSLEAAQHILNKYDYFKEDIQTTERFIQLAASRSTLTGKDYQVQCNNQPSVTSRDWLMTELQNFRSNQYQY
ncbi:DUF5329 family protein [Endozoicomonas sp. SM1973]|uniref:DUF5329 family protein n=1 Tax=Spartinivicinus marinus TaxID=2994442 RepID=A0A853I0F5_9GAMM|nr:DUF5329 family protein [Spartinivicinus marinus]MCX4028427.1 DUF5329 family protein [Spartinivicinus marinus]NYZ67460.1 DUF5329 family protein [Spartinivicinus marinus]